MLDLYSIVFTSVVMLIVIVRAVQADRDTPWFQSIKKAPPSGAQKQGWQRRG
jgi:hypothetical protein